MTGGRHKNLNLWGRGTCTQKRPIKKCERAACHATSRDQVPRQGSIVLTTTSLSGRGSRRGRGRGQLACLVLRPKPGQHEGFLVGIGQSCRDGGRVPKTVEARGATFCSELCAVLATGDAPLLLAAGRSPWSGTETESAVVSQEVSDATFLFCALF